MRNFIYVCIIGLLALSCDDGDIFEITLDFDKELDLCIDVNDSEKILLYDTKNNPSESLSLIFPSNSTNNLFLAPTEYNSTDPIGYTGNISIDNSNTRFNYRTYTGDPNDLICQFIANPGTEIVQDYAAAAGAKAAFITTFEDDDNDGILTIFEDRGLQDADGSYPNARDTDNDGLPDYIDSDDDNDGILTINENADDNGDGDPADAQNTNFDQENGDDSMAILPDYLDPDDDGDGTLSANENENGNGSLLDDFDQSTDPNNTTPRYLDVNAKASFAPAPLVPTTYTRTTVVNVTIENVNIEILSADVIVLGAYTYTTILPLP